MNCDWIKMRNNLDTDPDVIYMARQLEIHECYVVGLLHKFWSWADQHASSGILRKILPTWIDRFVSCPGFSDALTSVGWLITESDSLILPHWNRHNGSSAKTRARDLFRKKARRNNGEEDNKSEHPDTCPNNSGQNLDEHPDTCPKKSGQNLNESSDECPEKSGKNSEIIRTESGQNSDKIRTREEKSREEKNNINTHTHTARARPQNLDEALSYSKNKPGYEQSIVQHWFSQRDSQGWIKANNQPVANWKSDLDAWVLSERHRQQPSHNVASRPRGVKMTEAERDKANTGLDPIRKIKEL